MSPALIADDRPQASDPVFFLLRPDREAACAIHRMAWRLRDAFGLTGEPIARERLHISLCGFGPYGQLTRRSFDEIDTVCASLVMPRFRAGFRWGESFRHPTRRPLVLRGDETLTGVAMLHAELAARLRRVGFARGQQAFTPHMTLLYDSRNPGEWAIEELDWLVRDIVLVCSLRGRHCHVELGRWPLQRHGET